MIDVEKEIKKLYDENMWFSDIHRNVLMHKVATDELKEAELAQILAIHGEEAKNKFKKVFSRMRNKELYYNVPTTVFETHRQSVISISCKYKFQKLVGKYRVVISPFYEYGFKAGKKFVPFTTEVQADNNEICIPYVFDHEDMYTVTVSLLLDEQELLLLSTGVYALDKDLYDLNCYKADFHMHTTYSDGYEPPEFVVISARECGMDIVAITDHNHFEGSVVAKKQAAELKLDMTVILGEEYSLEYSPMHILSLGTKQPIDRKYLSSQVMEMDKTKELVSKSQHLNCDPYAFACTQVLLDEVNRLNGVSILAHPYWKPINQDGSRMDTPESLYIALGKDKRFCGIEIVSGSQDGEFYISNLQAALSLEILNEKQNLPVIGITDSHYYSSDPISGKHYTVVFSRGKEQEEVLEALRNGLCVAVEIVNCKPLCYGNLRLIKYTEFLVKYVFPYRDKIAQLEAWRAKEKLLL